MGYHTSFWGNASFNKEVDPVFKAFINRFNEERHVKRDPEVIKKIDPLWMQHCFDGDLGPDGAYYTVPMALPVKFIKDERYKMLLNGMADNSFGDLEDISVTDNDNEPEGCPGLYCPWRISEEGKLIWDGWEKPDAYLEWLKYLIDHFFAPKGFVLNGHFFWEGEEIGDYGTIYIKDNLVSTSSEEDEDSADWDDEDLPFM